MTYLEVDTEEPICAIATPLSESALGVVRLTGKGSLDLLFQRFQPIDSAKSLKDSRVRYGVFRDAVGVEIDDVVAVLWYGPKSYTGQDGADLMAHGNPGGLVRIMESLISAGFRRAGAGEFTLRAFLNGKIDLTQAEAIREIVQAKTGRAQQMALRRLHGGINAEITHAKARVLNLLAAVNIQLDYDETDVETMDLDPEEPQRIAQGLEHLSSTYRHGRLFQEGISVVLAGPVNAGKSSLFNRLVQEERSIVSDEEGTTRDFLEAWISLEGVPVRLFDTAGIREAQGMAEAEGMRRGKDLLLAAHIVLFVVDGTQPLSDQPYPFPEEAKVVRVWNKVDVAPPPPTGWIGVSATQGTGWMELHQALTNTLKELGGSWSEGELAMDSLRQKTCLDRATAALTNAALAMRLGRSADAVALDLQEALDALGEITGEVTNADILAHMFGSFCVGK